LPPELGGMRPQVAQLYLVRDSLSNDELKELTPQFQITTPSHTGKSQSSKPIASEPTASVIETVPLDVMFMTDNYLLARIDPYNQHVGNKKDVKKETATFEFERSEIDSIRWLQESVYEKKQRDKQTNNVLLGSSS
jgi:hypothetical protein